MTEHAGNGLDELMTDEDFVKAIEAMGGEEDGDIGELLKAMNENRIISWEEAERILQDTGTEPVKSSLPPQTRPSEPDNDTDVERCIQRLNDNDPTLKEINLNNMKRTPVPQVKRIIEALAYNEFCERLSLANMSLYDNDVATLITVVEMNQTLKKINLETNYLSGDFFAKLFKASCTNMTLEEIKAVNQGVSFATTAEKEIINAVVANNGLTKVSINLRLPEGRHKIENATLRNGEYRRILRREAALKAKRDAEELAKNPVPKLPKEPKKAAPKAPPTRPCATKPATSATTPTIASSAKGKATLAAVDTKKAPASVAEKPKPKVVPKKAPAAAPAEEEKPKVTRKTSSHLARRQSNADPSATPILNIACGNVKPAEKSPLKKTAPKTAKTTAEKSSEDKPAVKKPAPKTTAKTTPKTAAVEKSTAETPVKKNPLKKKTTVKPEAEPASDPAAKKSVEEKSDKPTTETLTNGATEESKPAPKKKIVKKVVKRVPKKKSEEPTPAT